MRSKKPDTLRGSRSALPVLVFSCAVVVMSLVPAVFPGIYSIHSIQLPEAVPATSPDRFEPGVWSAAVILSNAAVLAIIVLHLAGRLPGPVRRGLRRIRRLEVSRRVGVAAAAAILVAYAATAAPEVATEEEWEDWPGIQRILDENLRTGTSPAEALLGGSPDYPRSGPHVKYMILYVSEAAFGNAKVLPFLGSILLVVMTCVITVKITRKRLAGIVAMAVLLQSNAFLTYDTSSTYSSFWAVFYLASLYFAYRFWPLSPVLFMLSVFSKPLSLLFVPMSAYFILRSRISRRKKIAAAASTAALVVLVAAAAALLLDDFEHARPFSTAEFWSGFSSFSHQLRWDAAVLLFVLPLMAGLFLVARRTNRHAESVMVMISGMLLIPPLLTGFTDQTNQPYRFVPLIAFFAVGVGMLLSRRSGG